MSCKALNFTYITFYTQIRLVSNLYLSVIQNWPRDPVKRIFELLYVSFKRTIFANLEGFGRKWEYIGLPITPTCDID